jgi:hypothetical protein
MDNFSCGAASSSNAPMAQRRSFTGVKDEPSDSSVMSSSPSSSPMIPRKRYSMGDDTDITIPSSSPHHSSGVVLKKPKLEGLKTESVHAPLGTVDPNSPKPAGINHGDRSSTSFTPQVARALLIETNNAIDTTNSLISYYKRKGRKTLHDKQRIVELEKQLREQKTTKTRCEVTLQAPAGTPEASSGAASLSVKQQPDMDIKPFGSYPVASGSNFLPPPFPAPVASGSRFPLPPFPAPFASGSNVQLPAASSTVRGVSDALRDVDLDVLPMMGLPNYGDTVDYMSDDDSVGGRFCRHAYRGPIADPGE